MSTGAHEGHLTGQDFERHSAETAYRQVLGGAKGRGAETSGSFLRELRGGSIKACQKPSHLAKHLSAPLRTGSKRHFIKLRALGEGAVRENQGAL